MNVTRAHTLVALTAVVTVGVGMSGCASQGDGPGATPGAASSPSAASVTPTPGTTTFLGDLTATVTLPSTTDGPMPLVVLVPGGAWLGAMPDLLMGLADDLADRGAAVVTISYRVSATGGVYPVPVEDVACGVAYAVDAVQGLEVSEVVVAGHSAGGYMGALVALTPDQFAAPDCPYEPVAPDSFIGLSGTYDADRLSVGAACRLFTCEVAEQKAWDGGNPIAVADRSPGVPVLLVAGTTESPFVEANEAQEFAAALTAGGHDVTVEILKDTGHNDTKEPEVAGPIIGRWLGLSEPEETTSGPTATSD